MIRGPPQAILVVEWISGSRSNDTLPGTDGQEYQVGQGGNDAPHGRGAVRNLSGLGGNDTMSGQGRT
jgi:hypothetical protein